jgi:hypothetical protein
MASTEEVARWIVEVADPAVTWMTGQLDRRGDEPHLMAGGWFNAIQERCKREGGREAP